MKRSTTTGRSISSRQPRSKKRMVEVLMTIDADPTPKPENGVGLASRTTTINGYACR